MSRGVNSANMHQLKCFKVRNKNASLKYPGSATQILVHCKLKQTTAKRTNSIFYEKILKKTHNIFLLKKNPH